MSSQLGKKLAAIGIGFLTIEASNQAFDYLLYPAVLYWLGSVKGGIVMTSLALIMNYSLVLVYNKTKADWFGFEWWALQESQNTDTLLGRVMRLGRMPAFVFLSWVDPFKAFVFMRGRQQAGLMFSRTDWKWFIAANLIGNLIWILMVSGALEVLKRVALG